MDYSFPRYLLSKQTVDDRALNRQVYAALVDQLPPQPVRIIEVGAGIGTMLARLLAWGCLEKADYIAVDGMAENIAYALEWLPAWGAANRLRVERSGPDRLRMYDRAREVTATFLASDVFAFIQSKPEPADLLIAHAFLDLLPLPESLPKIFALVKPGGLAWLTINFDGVTTFEPELDPGLEAQIERLYHRSMERRPAGGDSRTGRHLFGHLRQCGAEVLAAGASDWVVFPRQGSYPADEAAFLNFILRFFETSLSGQAELDAAAFSAWLAERRAQVERGELVYIAHQMDFLVRL